MQPVTLQDTTDDKTTLAGFAKPASVVCAILGVIALAVAAGLGFCGGDSQGEIYNTITNGRRKMPSYAAQVPVEDRWAIVLYVRALQRSQHAGIEDVPEERRDQLR